MTVRHIQQPLIPVCCAQVLEKGMRFTMRDGRSTLGYGVVTELLAETDLTKYEEQRKKEKKAKKAEEAQ